MDFIDRLQGIGERFTQLKESVSTEEATKTAFVMPFLSTLGFDVFNPMEVIPEYTADIGLKKGEKVDYCVFKDGSPILIIECKHWKENLDVHNSQLHRYFHATKTRFGLLTNGNEFRFYSDLDEDNKMDDKPFFEFKLTEVNDIAANELKKFHKENFDVEKIVSNASDLKYSKQIKELLSSELSSPSDDFVKYFASRVYAGRITSKVFDQFKALVVRSSKQLLSEMISKRLQSALDTEEDTRQELEVEVQEAQEAQEDNNGIVTTEDELKGFRIVQAILGQHVDLDRVTMRDTKSYFGVLLDDNNRKPICRLHFNGSKWSIGVFDADKKETKIQIERLEEIYQHSEKIVERVKLYES